jgi:hypothetical protein
MHTVIVAIPALIKALEDLPEPWSAKAYRGDNTSSILRARFRT